jgi:prepilin-type N-terminal cleavage/methylation domain-containing protein
MRSSSPNIRPGFTLLELLVVIGIISMLAVVTVISIQRVTRDVKLSNGVNRVLGALATARTEAIRTNTPTLLTFRMVKDLDDPSQPAQVEMVVAGFTGEIVKGDNSGIGMNAAAGTTDVCRFVPSPEVAPRYLPEGIMIAGPSQDIGIVDDPTGTWNFMSPGPWTPVDQDNDGRYDYYRSAEAGSTFGVLFGADGTVITRNPEAQTSSSNRLYNWVDYDNERDNGGNYVLNRSSTNSGSNTSFFQQRESDSESFINVCQFLAVYDEIKAKQDIDYTQFIAAQNSLGAGDFIELRDEQLGTWLDENADRIHFNRYTGLAKVGGS